MIVKIKVVLISVKKIRTFVDTAFIVQSPKLTYKSYGVTKKQKNKQQTYKQTAVCVIRLKTLKFWYIYIYSFMFD